MLSIYSVPGTVSSSSHALSHLIFQHPKEVGYNTILILCNEGTDTQSGYLIAQSPTLIYFNNRINWAFVVPNYTWSFNICSHNQLIWLKMTSQVCSCCDSDADIDEYEYRYSYKHTHRHRYILLNIFISNEILKSKH